MSSGRELEYRRLRAPQETGTALVDPPLAVVGAALEANRERRKNYCYDVQGRCLLDLARQARRELLAEARRWTSAYRDVPSFPNEKTGTGSDEQRHSSATAAFTEVPVPVFSGPPILLAGHQPQLFHPGVWFKNFALGALGGRHGAAAINLVIDSDSMKTNTVRVPGGSVEEPVVASLPIDHPGPQVPFEERPIIDRDLFGSFGRRAARQIAPLVPDPLVNDFWPAVLERARETGNLGYCLAQARHQWEGRWGCQTLELPQSRVCDTESHHWLVAHLVAQAARFRTVYNEVVDEYRRVHHIRSTAHPVPDLAADGQWIEAPFWIWTNDDPRRRHLFVCRRGPETILSNRHGLETALPLTPDGDARPAVDRLADMARRGVKIRSRALITTLWARLVLGDLFVHGIGGAKYDQVTDALIARFFGLEPPEFMVISATLRLPVPRPRTEAPGAIRHQLRDLDWHPERHIPAADRSPAEAVPEAGKTAADLAAKKLRWVETPQTTENARTRFQEIRRLNQALQPHVAAERTRLLDEVSRSASAARADAILSSREYAFCLYPETTLRDTFSQLLT